MPKHLCRLKTEKQPNISVLSSHCSVWRAMPKLNKGVYAKLQPIFKGVSTQSGLASSPAGSNASAHSEGESDDVPDDAVAAGLSEYWNEWARDGKEHASHACSAPAAEHVVPPVTKPQADHDAKVREATGAHPPIADSSLACGQPRRRLRGKSAGGPCPSVASAFPGHTPGAGSSTACARPPRHRLSLHYRRLLRKAKAHGQQVVKGTTTATAGEGGKGSQAMGRLTLISMFYR